ncbi:nucleic-acid-binding protein from transposon X-element [Trichonephila clavata]|uniref:Nucleic-acid-binding protein from transposon X-element n=1 Tax=Trichonephila clavata TaxID=2740835 RepID=A0A8X6LBI9_TRICU|nr:nucleic-acid-binding protein from transposon X-element [Trichonephila clavata]
MKKAKTLRKRLTAGSDSKPAAHNLESTKCTIQDQYSFKLPNKKVKADLRPTTPPLIATANSAISTQKDLSVQPSAETPKRKIDPIMLRFTENYNLIFQDLQTSHPTAEKSYVGDYIKIIAKTDERHREITQIFTNKNLEYYVIQSINNRPLKLVIKGLPVTAKCDEIKNDLIEKEIKVEKFAQLTMENKKSTPIYLIEITRDENVTNIYKINHCLVQLLCYNCYITFHCLCYNCNFFHHARVTELLHENPLSKCEEPHRTSDSPITEKIEDPVCFECHQHGHFTYHSKSPKFLKLKPKKKRYHQI